MDKREKIKRFEIDMPLIRDLRLESVGKRDL